MKNFLLDANNEPSKIQLNRIMKEVVVEAKRLSKKSSKQLDKVVEFEIQQAKLAFKSING